MEFDRTKVLTIATVDKLEEGQLGWINNTLDCLERESNDIEPYPVYKSKDSEHPFRAKGKVNRIYFYPAPEPTYSERQAQWLEKNGIKVGSRVNITMDGPAGANTSGFYLWDRKKLEGKSHVIQQIHSNCIVVEGWSFPYTSLEKAEEPSYRPYNEEELNNLVGEVLTHKYSGCRWLATRKSTVVGVIYLDGNETTAEQLLENFYRNDKEICGVIE